MTGSGIRYWPGPDPPPEHVEAKCASCHQQWHVGLAMAGHRLRCDCGEWIDVPAPAGTNALRPSPPAEPPSEVAYRVDVKRGYREAPGSMEPILDVPTRMPMEAGTLRHANVETKQRWTNRLVLELAGIVLAFWIPGLVLLFMASDDAALLYAPLADVVSGLAVLIIAAGAAHYTFAGLRAAARDRHYVEAVCAAALFVGLAEFWFRFLEHSLGVDLGPDLLHEYRRVLGWGWAFAVIAIFPAVFEELAFRGLVQGRVSALQGRTGGILITGTVFALAHGVTLGLPFHALGGFYLCWLRARSGSLYPGMLLHGIYNGSLLLLHGGAM